MKKEKYIVEIEMPDGDGASPSWVYGVLQSDADLEDEGRWKVSVKDNWKPSDKQMEVLLSEVTGWTKGCPKQIVLESLYQDLKKLREE